MGLEQKQEQEQPAMGESLDERMQQQGGRLALDEVLRVGIEAAWALAQAHAEGRWHGALNLQNLKLGGARDPAAKVHIKVVGWARTCAEFAETLQRSGMSPPIWFCAPEQLSGEVSADARCDVFALGAIIYYLLTSVPPYAAASREAHLALLRTRSAQLLRQLDPDLPPELEELVGWMLAKRRDERPSMALVHNRLRELQRQPAGTSAPGDSPTAPTFEIPPVSTQSAPESASRLDGELAAFAAIATALALIAVAYLWHAYLDVPAAAPDLRTVDLSSLPDLATPDLASDLAGVTISSVQDLGKATEPADLRQPEDLRIPPDLIVQPPHRWVCRPAAPTQECVNQDISAALRQKIVDSLASVEIRLCLHEQLVWNRFSTRMELDRRHSGAARRVSIVQERQFSQALVGRMEEEKLPGDIIVNCAQQTGTKP